MGKSKIEWTDETWNPITGCTPISEGCAHCYAKRMANRLKGRYGYPQGDPFRVTFHPDRINQPLRWGKPRRIFVCSMGDLFHDDVEWNWLYKIFEMMAICKHHTFLVLTKRVKPEIIDTIYFHLKRNYGGIVFPLSNVWFGVTAENQQRADERIPILLQIPAAVRFVSVEPMLGEINLKMALEAFQPLNPDLSKKPSPVQWIICGGESGSGARPMHPDWARSVRDQCIEANIPFFFKQWGEWALRAGGPYKDPDKKLVPTIPGNTRFDEYYSMHRIGKKAAGRLLDGREWNEVPK